MVASVTPDDTHLAVTWNLGIRGGGLMIFDRLRVGRREGIRDSRSCSRDTHQSYITE